MKAQSPRKVWEMPVLLAFITLSGLTSALLGTGFWYPLSWALMSLPIVVMLWKIYVPKSAKVKG